MTRRACVAVPIGLSVKPLCFMIGSATTRETNSATSPTRNVTRPITSALATRTRPRRGCAASVVRIMPRRYSAVMNSTPSTTTTASPANVPIRVRSRLLSVSTAMGAMSPAPLTVNPSPLAWKQCHVA